MVNLTTNTHSDTRKSVFSRVLSNTRAMAATSIILWIIAAGLSVVAAAAVWKTSDNHTYASSAEVRYHQDSEPRTVDVLTAEASPWPQGGRIILPVGETSREVVCSVAFSFTSENASWAVTSGHCAENGDVVLGEDYREAGTIVSNALPESDWALVKITDDDAVTTTTNEGSGVRPTPPAMSILAEPLPDAREVALRGSTSSVESGVIYPNTGEVGMYGDDLHYSTACARKGDSGGAATTAAQSADVPLSGVLVGVIATGVGECFDNEQVRPGETGPDDIGSGVAPAYGIAEALLEQVPDARLTLKQATL